MAKYVPSGIGVGELRNKAGSNVFSRNRFGTYVRNKANPVQPRTGFQLSVRETFVALAKHWRGLTDAQRLDWGVLGAQIQRVDALNQVYTLTGLQAFILVNMRRVLAGLSILNVAPIKDTVTDITSFSVTLAAGPPPSVSIDFAPAIQATERVVVYATAPMSQGIHFLGRPIFRQIFISDAGATSPLSVSAAYISRFPFPDVGQRVAFMLEVWSANFIPGNQVKTSVIRT